jgi:hypothetical protein
MPAAAVFRRDLTRGALLWLIIGAVGVAVRGVQWDEGYERAQAMLGMVAYPAGHPLYHYGWSAFTIQYYASAALLRLTESPLLLCGLRNLLAIWIMLLPMFLLGAAFTRSILAGHIAALLMLCNAHHVFQSYYDNNIWPGMFTSGSIGLGWALCCVCAFACARWRLGAALVMAMPLIHGGQWPPVLGLLLCVTAWHAWKRQRPELRQLVQGSAIGLALTAVFLGIHLLLRHDLPDYGQLLEGATVSDTWQRFTYFEDIHRRPLAPPRFGPFAHTSIGLLFALLLAFAWLRTAMATRGGELVPAAVGAAYIALCAAAVWTAWAVQQVLGAHTPYLIIGWLPYRLGNHAVLVMICLAAAVVACPRAGSRRGPTVALAALAWIALRDPLGAMLPETFHARYVLPPEGPLFLLTGAAIFEIACISGSDRERGGVIGLHLPRNIQRSVVCAAFLLFLLLAWRLQFLALCLAGGVVLCIVVARIPGRVLYAPIVLAVLFALGAQWNERSQLPVTAFEQEVREFLAQEEDRTSLIVTPLYNINYQEKLARGVFATFETQLLIPYMPALGPRIEAMLSDMYGMRFGQPWRWELDHWQARTPAEWQALAERWQLGYVLCPEEWPLQLPECLRGDGKVLYKINH